MQGSCGKALAGAAAIVFSLSGAAQHTQPAIKGAGASFPALIYQQWAAAYARESGVAQTVDQMAEGVTGTAAVIHDAAGKVVGALIVAAPSARLQDRLPVLAKLVREEAAAIARSLGYRGA